MKSKRAPWIASVVLAILVAVLFSGGGQPARVGAAAKESYEGLETFTNILSIIQKNYVDDVQTKQLIEGAINGMLASLDPHSAYLTPDLYKELQVDTKGSFGGLGIEITNRNGVLTVVSPIEDTPAYRAGVKSGDQIMKINGEFSKDMTLVDAVKKMRGPKDTKVTLTLKRESTPDIFDVTMTREIIKIQSVKWKKLEPGYGYVRVTQFQERTDDDLERALKPLDDTSALRLTTARYYTPSGRSIQALGIVPDIVMDQTTLLAKTEKPGGALLREANLPRHLQHSKSDRETGPAGKGDEGPGGGPGESAINVKEGELGSHPQLDHPLEPPKSRQGFTT